MADSSCTGDRQREPAAPARANRREIIVVTRNDMVGLLSATPFIPFRLHLSSGGHVDVRHREFTALVGRRFTVIGIPDPQGPDDDFDRYVVVCYMHVTNYEMLLPGPPPGREDGQYPGQPGTPAGTPS